MWAFTIQTEFYSGSKQQMFVFTVKIQDVHTVNVFFSVASWSQQEPYKWSPSANDKGKKFGARRSYHSWSIDLFFVWMCVCVFFHIKCSCWSGYKTSYNFRQYFVWYNSSLVLRQLAKQQEIQHRNSRCLSRVLYNKVKNLTTKLTN